jgi:predicted enzyme related to lactoylglutathione lyase
MELPKAPPHGALAHFAVNTDDLGRSQRFYEALFGWRFTPWGPPGFFQIERPTAPFVHAALQKRRDLLDGVKTVGFECTIAVDDLAAAVAKVVPLGGRIVMEPVTIPTVCELAMIEDPSGNVLGIAHYVVD